MPIVTHIQPMSVVTDYAVLRKPARTQAPPRISTDLEAAGTFAGNDRNDLWLTLEVVCFCARVCKNDTAY